jgi:hypothetical protein
VDEVIACLGGSADEMRMAPDEARLSLCIACVEGDGLAKPKNKTDGLILGF